MPTTELTDQTLSEFITSRQIAIVRFHAPWCSACKMFGPVYKAVSDKLPNLAFGELNTDQNQGASRQYAIKALPTTIIFKDGVAVSQFSGGTDPNGFADRLQRALMPQGG